MVGRGELTDTAWAAIPPLLPSDGRRALARHTGTVWAVADVLRPFRALAARWHLGAAPVPRPRQVGCGERRARRSQLRQHGGPGAPARHRGTTRAEPDRCQKGAPHPADEALGRSQGGLTTKVHLAC